MICITEGAHIPVKTCVALGFFDGLHKGHRAVLAEAHAHAPYAPAVFTFAARSFDAKGALKALLTEELKREAFASLGIHYLYAPDFEELRGFSAEDFVREVLVRRMNAAHCVCGYDFHFGRNASADASVLEALCKPHGIGVTVIPPLMEHGAAVSSTAIRQALSAGDMETANDLLGYPFTFRGEVVHGNAKGRTIRFPTINQYFAAGQAVPRYGVYASETLLHGEWRRSVTNIGVRPTVGEGEIPVAETFILDCEENLYGQNIAVRLHAYLRGEEKLPDFEALKARILADVEYVRGMAPLTDGKEVALWQQ